MGSRLRLRVAFRERESAGGELKEGVPRLRDV
jgi:hypothetical protein